MKFAWGMAILLAAGFLALWLSGYSLHIDKSRLDLVGPARLSPYDGEAEANSSECQGLRERFPEKAQYTQQELDERSNAATACQNAKIRYIKGKSR
jgi:hypothetical protein